MKLQSCGHSTKHGCVSCGTCFACCIGHGCMTREKAEANWIWDPQKGDIRPPSWPKNRRIPCSDININAQQRLARPETLIHTMANTSCPRKKSKIDAPKFKGMEHSGGASFIDNVNCLWCRRDYFKPRVTPDTEGR